MAPLVVDPEALCAVGGAVVAVGDGLAADLTVLTAGCAAHTGRDVAGMVFGLAYQDAAESVLKAAAAAINACRHTGAVIQQGASNYSRAEAASTFGGGAGVLQAATEPPKITAPGPPGTLGPGQPPPLLWAFVQSLVDDVWPDGDVAGLHAASARWRSLGAAVSGMQGALNASRALLDAQQIPEGGKIDEAVSQLGTCIAKIGEQCGKLATSIDDFANEVDHAQNKIRDLLHRLESLADLGHDVMLIIEGDALDEIEKIAEDIDAVLHNLGREARAFEQGIKLVMQVGDGLVVKLEKHVRRELTRFVGEEVGNPVATVFDTWANVNEGVLKGAAGMALGIVDLDPRWFLIDPQGAAASWSGMAESMWRGSLINAFLNPQEAREANLQQLKSLLHLDDWSTARPGLGLGENIFDVATQFMPGAGEAGAAARGAEAAADAADAAGGAGERAAEGLGRLAGARDALADIAGTGGSLTGNLEGVTADLPTIDPPVGGRPVGLPVSNPSEAPVEPAPRAPDAGPATAHRPMATEPPGPSQAGGPHDPVSAPARGAREPMPEPAGRPHPAISAPASGSPAFQSMPAASERLPSAVSQLVDHSPARVPVAPSGSPVEPAPVTVHRAQPVPAPSSAAPHFTPPSAQPPELPASGGGGWHGPGDGGRPHEGLPHGREKHRHGDGGVRHRDVDGSPPEDGEPHGDGSRPDSQPPDSHGDDGNSADQTHDAVHDPRTPVAGLDYPFSPEPAIELLSHPDAEVARLAEGKVPAHILDGYDPLAGRTPEDFTKEFTVRDGNGNVRWDWDNQAPNNGFAGEPEMTDHIPANVRLDRIGSNGGSFMSIEGEPLSHRGTPPGLASQYHTMSGSGEPVPDNWTVLHGPAKEAFGQPGGADQWVVIDKLTKEPVPVEILDQVGTITDLTP